MSDNQDQLRVRDPGAPATEAQRALLVRLGVDPNAANDPHLTRGTASDWISEFKRAETTGSVPPRGGPPAQAEAKPAPVQSNTTAPAFTTADQLPTSAAPPTPTAVETYSEDEDRGPLTPVTVLSPDERKQYGLEETETVVIRGTKWKIIPELGMPAKFVFARLTVNRRTNRAEARLFPSIEGLMFRANAYADGIRKLRFDFIKAEDVPGLGAFLEETKDPQIICRATVTLGNGTEVVEEGTVRVSEIKLYQSRKTGRMVSRSPVARSNFVEIAKKRALARALRWGTGYGGTALDELPADESEGARERAGLKSGAAAMPGLKGE